MQTSALVVPQRFRTGSASMRACAASKIWISAAPRRGAHFRCCPIRWHPGWRPVRGRLSCTTRPEEVRDWVALQSRLTERAERVHGTLWSPKSRSEPGGPSILRGDQCAGAVGQAAAAILMRGVAPADIAACGI